MADLYAQTTKLLALALVYGSLYPPLYAVTAGMLLVDFLSNKVRAHEATSPQSDNHEARCYT